MNNVSGIDGAAPIWHDSMLAAEKNRPMSNFAYPGGLQHLGIIYPDGLQTTDWFLPNTYPSYHQPGKAHQHDKLTFNGHPYCSNYSFVTPYVNVNRSVW